MENLSKKEKILIAVLALIAIVYVYYLLVLKPIYAKIDVENQKIAGYNSQIVTANNLAAKNKKDQIDLDALRVKVLDLTPQLPKVEKNPQIAFDIKKSADNYGLGIKDLNFTTPTEYKLATVAPSTGTTNQAANAATTKANQLLFAKLQIVPVKITVTGNYTKIMNFVQEIETGVRIGIIKSVDITAALSDSTGSTTAPKTTSMVNTTSGITVSQMSSKQGNIKNIILLNDLQPSTGTTSTNGTTSTSGTSSSTGTTSLGIPAAPTYEVQAVIAVDYYYVLSETNIGQYNFNTGTYGKTDLFK